MENEQSRAVSMVVEAEHADGGTTRSLGPPIHFDGEAPYARSAAPRVGQQTHEVLRKFGFSEAEMQSWAALRRSARRRRTSFKLRLE